MKTALTKLHNKGLTVADIKSANKWLTEQGVDLQFEVDTFTLSKTPLIKDNYKIDEVWLDTEVHRKRLPTHTLSVFTADREWWRDLNTGAKTLRGWQSFPNLAIGEIVVMASKATVYEKKEGGVIKIKTDYTSKKGTLTQGAYSLIHETCHWGFDRLRKVDVLHEYIEQYGLTGMALALKIVTPIPDKPVKYTPDFIIKRNLTHHYDTNNPTSIVFHTLLGTLEGSYSWLDHIKLSYNYLISKEGKVYEMVHWSKGAWHAGRKNNPNARARVYYGTKDPNLNSIGIAFERNGEERLTGEQVSEAVKLCKYLGQQTGYTYSYDNVFAHYEIAVDKPKEVLTYREQILDALIGEKVEEPPTGTPVEINSLIQQVITLINKWITLKFG